MNVEDLVRNGMREAADEVTPITGLHDAAVLRGRRRRAARRVATAGGVALSIAAITATGVFVADNTGGSGHHVQPAGHGPSTQHLVADPWWDTWTTDRYYGRVDPAFLSAARPTYDTSKGQVDITVYAAGTTTDGSEWAMYTDPTEGHKIEWLMGRNNRPVEGEVPAGVDPGMTWTSWSFPTQSAEDGRSGNQQWMIVVGRPGTTEIDYSIDGSTWQPMEARNGIAVKFLPNGFPPDSARVRLSDTSGVYAVGKPEGAGAGDDASPSASPTPGPGEATPTATPSVGPVSTTVPASAVPSPSASAP
jgi:hypothetical protein